jgi:glycosyltransferase involved in cell wall biosynthesis
VRILAFQPWDGGSHRAVRRVLERHALQDWTWFGLDPVGPRWRLRLGAAELVTRAAEAGGLEAPADLIFTTGLLDASQLKGLLPPHLSRLPMVVYMHENQAAYPASDLVTPVDRERDAHLVATNIASLIAADLVLWNSRFNRDSFLEGARDLLRHAPGRLPRRWVEMIEERSRIAWPPVEPIPGAVLRNPEEGGYPDGVRVAWPHRWEHDKGPDELLEIADRLAESCNLRFVLLGERGGRVPPELEMLRSRHAARIEHDGYMKDRGGYLELLSGCDWVLSTARHEFFGIAVVEALQCGCLPWLPERLSYPELLPESARGLSPEDPPPDPEAVRRAVRTHLAGAMAPKSVERIEGYLGELVERSACSPGGA